MYLDKCPEWDSIVSTDAIFIPILKNGNLCPPVEIKGKTILIRNTCAFNAIIIIVVLHDRNKHCVQKYYTR